MNVKEQCLRNSAQTATQSSGLVSLTFAEFLRVQCEVHARLTLREKTTHPAEPIFLSLFTSTTTSRWGNHRSVRRRLTEAKQSFVGEALRRGQR